MPVKYELGISTGLACPNMPIVEAVESLCREGAEVIELCLGAENLTPTKVKKLNDIQKSGGVAYTIHTQASLKIDGKPDGLELIQYLSNNRSSFDLADRVNARWLVQHPPIIPMNYIPENNLIVAYLHFLAEISPKPVAIETGVYRRNTNGEIIAIEDARTPKRMQKYLTYSKITGIVGDVPKMSRSNQSYDNDRRCKEDISDYILQAKRLDITFRELHIVGTNNWPEDMDFAYYTMSLLAKKHTFANLVLMIESTPERLETALSTVKRFIINQ
ncbi:MAG: hypothetical protein Q7R97_00970 [Candidatus Daviesbacteria bacterium]|nr:hypothetical protein [Candidatus Daviesbacteria bacterium]